MKLIGCYIENFGGLHQYTAHFEDGLTVIREPNGFGKTTLAEFIRAMFYGFPRGGKDLEKNPRLKYLPWQGGRYGGYLIFEQDGKRYRIDRTFGEVPRLDKAKLFDETSHRESRDYSPDQLGLQLFGMDGDSFLRSTYLPQTPVSGSLSTDNIRAKLGNLLEDSDDLGSYEKAMQRLRDKRSAYEHFRGSGGSIYETQKQITALQNRLDECRRKQPELAQTTDEIRQLRQARALGEQALRRIRTRLTEASSALAEAALSREYEALLARKHDADSRLQGLRDRYPMGLPTQNDLDAVSRSIDEMTLRAGMQEPPSDSNPPQTASPKKLHGGFLPLLIFGMFTAAAGLCLLILPALPDSLAALAAQYQSYIHLIFANRIPAGSVCCGAAALMLTAAIALQMKHKLRRELAAEAAMRAEQIRSAQEAANAQLAVLQADLDAFNRTYGLNVCDRRSLRTVERDTETAPQLEAAAAEAAQALERFLVSHGPKPASALPKTDCDSVGLKAAEQQLIEKQSARNTRLLQLEQRQRILETEVDRIPELTDELARCIARKAEDTDARRLLDETAAFLEQARESLSRSYLGGVQGYFADYMQRLCSEAPERIIVNTDLEVQLERAGSARPLSQFSAGQTDLVKLCMRLALSDALFQNEHCFLILDDPFVNLDDDHLKQALELLQELAEDRQIVYLVCSRGRIGKELS